MRCESREVSLGVYELVIVGPDGSERVERFADSPALHTRQVVLEKELEQQGWTGPHGWHL